MGVGGVVLGLGSAGDIPVEEDVPALGQLHTALTDIIRSGGLGLDLSLIHI